jgi:hypothetical protein
MHSARIPIAESPEELGHDTIRYNLPTGARFAWLIHVPEEVVATAIPGPSSRIRPVC